MTLESNEEWNNFIQRVTEVSTIVKELTSGDEERAKMGTVLADKYLRCEDILTEDNIEMRLKCDRTVINHEAFKKPDPDANTMEPQAWMAEVSKDADRRYQDKKVRREKADTQRTMATKAFRRGDYDRALSCYNRAIEHIRDNSNMYVERALTLIKLKKYEKVVPDCEWALRINEDSFKARLYMCKAYLELEELAKYVECKRELDEKFHKYKDLIDTFLNKDRSEESE